MKSILKYTLLVALTFLSVGCEDFLNKTPNDTLDPQTYMTNKDEAFYMLTAVYDPMGRSNAWGLNLIATMQQDDLSCYNRAQPTDNPVSHSATPSSVVVTNTWNTLYVGVGRANLFLDRIDQVPMDAKLRDQYKGEALFLRALYHFALVQNWGAIPLRTSALKNVNDTKLARTPAPQVLEQIVKDLKDAEPLVGSAIDNGLIGARVTQSAVQGILSRVYLHMAGAMYKAGVMYEPGKTYPTDQFDEKEMYENALAYAYKVKASGLHRLNIKTVFFNYDNYSGLVKNDYTTNPAIVRLPPFKRTDYTKKNYADPNANTTVMNDPSPGHPSFGFDYMDLFRRYAADEFDTEFRESILEACAAGNGQDPVNREQTNIATNYGAQFANDSYKNHPGYYNYAYFIATTSIWNLFQKDLPANKVDLRQNTSMYPFSYQIRTNVQSGFDLGDLRNVNILAYVPKGTKAKAVVPLATAKPATTVYADWRRGEAQYTESGRFVGKFSREYDPFTIRGKNTSSCNTPIIRYADVLLMIAEAAYKVNELGGVKPAGMVNSLNQEIFDCVNEVRKRAGVDATTPSAGAITLDFIKDERARELCFEGIRRNDLIRWGQYLSTMYKTRDYLNNPQNQNPNQTTYPNTNHIHSNVKTWFLQAVANVEAREVLYPIPTAEIAVNPLCSQNPGY